ncbi:MAG: RICIN domain-containing protein [Verrucomicrobia bacterium]|nr:RICIN domain-containing protein [Verrucomicrobiota bacterium]
MLGGDAIALRGCQDVVVSGNFFAPLVNGNALDLATVNTLTLANNRVEYTGTVQNRIARNTGTVTSLAGLNNGVLFAGRSTALTNTPGGFLLSAFSFEWVGGGYHQILSATTGQALGVGASTTSGARVGLEAANGSDGQLWRLAPFGTADADTTLTLVNKLSGHTVTVSNGTLIQQAAVRGSTGQIWTPGFPANYVYATWATGTGASTAVTTLTTVTADNDGDGLANLVEYALATPPLAAGPGPALATATLTVNGTPASYLTISFSRRVAASDLTLAVEYSGDLATWTSSAVLAASVPSSDGTTTETWRAPAPVGTTARDFLRVLLTKP